MEKNTVKIGELEFTQIEGVTIVLRKGRGRFTMIGIFDKNGELHKYVMQPVREWFGENAEALEL